MSKKALLLLSSAAVAVLALVIVLAVRGAIGSSKYGVPIDPTGAKTLELASLFADPQAYVGKRVIVDAEAAIVCQTSGCWITVTDGPNQLLVRFYDFTVKLRPGARVRVQGEIRLQNNAPYLVGQALEVVR